jgi:hypothetical protein
VWPRMVFSGTHGWVRRALNSACRSALDDWTAARAKQLQALAEKGAQPGSPDALWLARGGGRLGSRAVDLVVRRLAADAGVELSAPPTVAPRIQHRQLQGQGRVCRDNGAWSSQRE